MSMSMSGRFLLDRKPGVRYVNDMSVITSNKEITRQNILDAAVGIFREKGFQKTRVSDIVAAAGLAQGTFYLYFRSKEEIAREICKNFMDSFIVIFETDPDIFESRTTAELHARIRRMVRAALAVFKKNAAAAEIVLREGVGQGGLFKELYENLIIRFIGLLRDRIDNGRSRQMLRVRDPETVAVFIVGLVERSFFFFMVMGKEVDVDSISQDMASFIINGLSAEI